MVSPRDAKAKWPRGVRSLRNSLRSSVLVFAAWLALAAPAGAQTDAGWRLVQEDVQTATRVWLRDRPGAVAAFRASTIIEARLTSLAAVLLDHRRTAEWVYRAREAVLLASDGPTRGVTLVVTAMPFPLRDRESIVAWEMNQDPQTLVVTLAGHGLPDGAPPNARRVRMPIVESRWQFTPRPDGRVDVLFEGLGDPGGNLAAPLLRSVVNAALWEGPWQTVRAMHEIVRRPPFPLAELPFIVEPAR